MKETFIKCRRCGFRISSLTPHTDERDCVVAISINVQAIVEQCPKSKFPSVEVARWVYDRYIRPPVKHPVNPAPTPSKPTKQKQPDAKKQQAP